MKRFIACTLLCLALVSLTGCFDTQEEFTLNPDGSGKVVIESVCSPLQLQLDQRQTPEQKLQGAIRSLLENVKGVAAWKDVTYERRDDGRIHFKGTAYFADINRVEFQSLAMINFTLKKGAGGQLVLAAQMNQGQNEKAGAQPPLSEADLAEKIKDAKGSYQSSRPMMVGFLATMKQHAIFHLPGTAGDISNFKATPAGDLRITYAGTNLLAAMDSLATNDDWWRLQLAGGRDISRDGVSLDDELNEKLFGQKAPVRAVIVTGAAKFDYPAEVSAAKTEYAALLQKLGPGSEDMNSVDEPVGDAPPAQGGNFKNLRVGGIRWIFESDDQKNVRPFNDSPGYTLSVIGQLPGSVLAVSGGILDTATGSDGSDLLPDQDWDRRINFPNLSTDHSTVVFELKLSAPGLAVKGFKEISGNLRYTVGIGLTNIDLGLTEIQAGAQGSEFGALIESIKPRPGQNSGLNIKLKLQLDPKEIISLKTISADGQETVLRQTSYSGYNKNFTYTYGSKVELPPGARLVVQKYGEIKKYSIPFKLTNLTLLGQPIN